MKFLAGEGPGVHHRQYHLNATEPNNMQLIPTHFYDGLLTDRKREKERGIDEEAR